MKRVDIGSGYVWYGTRPVDVISNQTGWWFLEHGTRKPVFLGRNRASAMSNATDQKCKNFFAR